MAISVAVLLVITLFAMPMFEDYFVSLGYERGSETVSMTLMATSALMVAVGAPGGWAANQLFETNQRAKQASDLDSAGDG
jgi:hypothetical protein